MKLNFKQSFGFTLVELLVVIAIIGILSSVAVVNLNSARDKAKQAAIRETLASLRTVAILCFSNNENIQGNGPPEDCDGLTISPDPSSAAPLCPSVDQVWPELQSVVTGWSWSGFCESDYAAGTYSYSASDGAVTITCTEAGCVTI